MQTSLSCLEDTSDSTFNEAWKKNAGKWLFQKHRAILTANTVFSATMKKGLLKVSLHNVFTDRLIIIGHSYSRPHTNTVEDAEMINSEKSWKTHPLLSILYF
jgi:hypothetical protein